MVDQPLSGYLPVGEKFDIIKLEEKNIIFTKENLQVFGSSDAQNSENSVYTVPGGKTLYVVSGYLTTSTASTYAGGFGSQVLIGQSSSAFRGILFNNLLAAGLHDTTISQSFFVPIKVNSGEKVIVVSYASTVVSCAGISGYILDNTIE